MTRARAPLRLGLAGGGTDLSPFCDEYGGAILNATVGKFAHCYIRTRDDGALVLCSGDLDRTETHKFGEEIDDRDGLRLHRGVYNRFLRLGHLKDFRGLNISTATDVPAGSGLGTSSALVVAMCEALRELADAPFGLYEIAHMAFEIERNDLTLAGGRQDQYAAAFGGVNFIEFLAQDRVIVNPLRVREQVLFEFESSLITCFTGVSRESDTIIRDQTSNMRLHDASALNALLELKEAAHRMKSALLVGDLREVGDVLNQSWLSKKKTATTISNSRIETLFDVARSAGAYAGKVSGAGGGGFLMLMSAPEMRANVLRALNNAGGDASPVILTDFGVQSWKTDS
ncbi:GHMP kinase [Methylosinus sp. Ce-a6]|uniref:GHMP family kinase ATP-binding protein n=1 Tax=Methylosinus sp. Ce-a6 TaxID=2172005 RepID=UPI001916881C|nr:GHMP kinase [Methylosinus sp. Ce-a6]